MSEEVLYSASAKTGTFYEEAKPEIEEEEESTDPLFDYRISLYLKVGLYCKWSWKEFDETPLPVIERISDEIDHRLDNFSQIYLNWECYYFLQVISKLLSGK